MTCPGAIARSRCAAGRLPVRRFHPRPEPARGLPPNESCRCHAERTNTKQAHAPRWRSTVYKQLMALGSYEFMKASHRPQPQSPMDKQPSPTPQTDLPPRPERAQPSAKAEIELKLRASPAAIEQIRKAPVI